MIARLVSGTWAIWLLALAVSGIAAGGCSSVSSSPGPAGLGAMIRPEAGPAAVRDPDPPTTGASVLRPEDFRGVLLASAEALDIPADLIVAQAQPGERRRLPLDPEPEEYDPWEPFNTSMFEFNRSLDRFVIKPAARAWDVVLPDVVKQMVENGFHNLSVVHRVANSLFQGRFKSAGVETGRFLINSTLGIGGLFDIANQEFGLRPVRADFGQTLGVFDTPPGPYLILPFLPPFTVRDAVGYGVDGAMNPLSYVIPFFWERLVLTVVDTVNTRALNLERFEGIEETTLDLYTAVRNAYISRRARIVEEAIQESFWKRPAP